MSGDCIFANAYICNVTSFLSDASTVLQAILVFLGAIRGYLRFIRGRKRKVVISHSTRIGAVPSEKDIDNAMRPDRKYEEVMKIVYNFSRGNPDSMSQFIKDFEAEIEKVKQDYTDVAMFGVSEMPVAIYMGNKIGNATNTHWYRSHRNLTKNKWLRANFFSPTTWGIAFEELRRKRKGKSKIQVQEVPLNRGEEINLIVEFSHGIERDKIPATVKNLPTYVVSLSEFNFNYLTFKSQLKSFEKQLSEIMKKIDGILGATGKVNLFVTVPVPFAYTLGKYIHTNGPKYEIFDLNGATNKYNSLLSLPN